MPCPDSLPAIFLKKSEITNSECNSAERKQGWNFTHRDVSNKGQVIRTALSLFVRAWSFDGFVAKNTALSSYSFRLNNRNPVNNYKIQQWEKCTVFLDVKSNLLTIISSPTPVARQSEPATLDAIFCRGRVIIGRPAHSTSVPVVWPLHNGLFIQQF